MFQTKKSTRRNTTRRVGLAREIAITLLAKLLLLYAMWWAFFSEPQLPNMIQGLDPGLVADQLTSPAIPKISNQP